MENAAGSQLFKLDVRRADHLAPFLGRADDKLIKLGWRARKHGGGEVTDPRPDLGIGEPRIDLLVELIDHLDGRAPGSSNPNPGAGLETRLEIAERRDVR